LHDPDSPSTQQALERARHRRCTHAVIGMTNARIPRRRHDDRTMTLLIAIITGLLVADAVLAAIWAVALTPQPPVRSVSLARKSAPPPERTATPIRDREIELVPRRFR
jgi:hypothetical protein